MLEEMDAEFGVGSLVEEELGGASKVGSFVMAVFESIYFSRFQPRCHTYMHFDRSITWKGVLSFL